MVIKGNFIEDRMRLALTSVAQLFGESSCTQKGGWFYSQSGYLLRLQAQSPDGVHMGDMGAYVCFLISFFYKYVNHIGLGPTTMTLF